MGELRPWHIIILVVVIFVLFGYKKLPDATRSLGRSLRILKTEVKSLHDDEPTQAAGRGSRAAAAPSRRRGARVPSRPATAKLAAAVPTRRRRRRPTTTESS